MANMLTFKRNHPQDRASYGIAGNPGIVVFQRGLFAGATVPVDNTDLAGLPRTIYVDGLVDEKLDNKAAKAEAAAAKAVAAAVKAQAKIEAAQAKAETKALKTAEILAKAQAKVAAAAAAITA